jgi:hypothetical protein
MTQHFLIWLDTLKKLARGLGDKQDGSVVQMLETTQMHASS